MQQFALTGLDLDLTVALTKEPFMSIKPETKDTQPPRTEPSHAAANPFASFDPIATWAASQQAFHKMMTEAYGRAQSFADEYAAVEAQMLTRAQGAIDGWAQLAHDSISYGAQLAAQARKLGLESAKKMGVGA
jgi:hypothetical protein